MKMLFICKKLIKLVNINYAMIDCIYNFLCKPYVQQPETAFPFRFEWTVDRRRWRTSTRGLFKWGGAYRDTESWSEQVPNLLSLAHANST